MGEVDVHADELAVVVLEVPGRIGRARADDQMAAVENLMQLALRDVDELGLGLRRQQQRGRSSGDRADRGTGADQRPTAEAASLKVLSVMLSHSICADQTTSSRPPS